MKERTGRSERMQRKTPRWNRAEKWKEAGVTSFRIEKMDILGGKFNSCPRSGEGTEGDA